MPTRSRVEIVDTTGAGNASNGGYLSARMQKLEPEEAVSRGHALAALAVETRGALVPADSAARL